MQIFYFIIAEGRSKCSEGKDKLHGDWRIDKTNNVSLIIKNTSYLFLLCKYFTLSSQKGGLSAQKVKTNFTEIGDLTKLIMFHLSSKNTSYLFLLCKYFTLSSQKGGLGAQKVKTNFTEIGDLTKLIMFHLSSKSTSYLFLLCK